MELIDDFEKEVEVEYEGERYLVRDNGAVLRKNQYRKKARRNDNKWSFGIPNSSSGYMFYSGTRVHRIVCSAFHGSTDVSELVVDHIDTNRQNNRAENLRWVTRLENILQNPITLRRIILAYGSLDAFFADPSKFQQKDKTQNIQWMRTVSKEEAQRTLERLISWSNSGRLFSGNGLGEWIYKKSTPSISEPSSNYSAISAQIDEWKKEGSLRQSDYHSHKQSREQLYFESETATAIQVKWRTKTEFPLCPEIVDENVLVTYRDAMRFGAVFSRNEYGSSKIVQSSLNDDDLVVLTRFDEADSPLKPWAVAHISADEEFVYHKNIGSFFTLQSALREYCDYTGEDYDSSVDDYI